MIETFNKRISVHEVEEGNHLQPKFDKNGLILVITVDHMNSEILMHGYMNPKLLDYQWKQVMHIIGQEAGSVFGKKEKQVVLNKRSKRLRLMMTKIA